MSHPGRIVFGAGLGGGSPGRQPPETLAGRSNRCSARVTPSLGSDSGASQPASQPDWLAGQSVRRPGGGSETGGSAAISGYGRAAEWFVRRRRPEIT